MKLQFKDVKIAIIGASNMQRPLVKKANEMGIETHVFAWEKGNVADDIATKFYPISILEKEQIYEVCKSINIDGITSVGSDLALDTVNYVAEKMDLVGNTLHSTELMRDKFLMRKKLLNERLPVPHFFSLENVNELNTINLTYPFMIKSSDRSGSKGIQLVNNENEAFEAFYNAKKTSLNKKVVAEDYFDGKQYSVEAISQNGRHHFVGITEEFYTGPPQFVETGHIMPGNLSNDNLKVAVDLTFEALDALKFKNGASHTELRVNRKNEFCFIEIAGRMGGDFRSELIRIAYDYDFLKDTILLTLGYEINPKITNAKRHSFIKWILTSDDISNFECAKNLNKIDMYELPNNPFISRGVGSSSDRSGFFIGHSDYYPIEFM